jgi:hypothetical protein
LQRYIWENAILKEVKKELCYEMNFLVRRRRILGRGFTTYDRNFDIDVETAAFL